MTDSPERIWAAATKWAVGHGPDLDWRFGHWKDTPVTVPAPKQEYLRSDHALALVAEAYEVAADVGLAICLEKGSLEHVTGINAEGEYSETVAREHRKYLSGIRRAGLAAQSAIRALTPSDALAAREARDKRVRDEALREAAHLVDQKYIALGRYGLRDAILALIEGDQTDE